MNSALTSIMAKLYNRLLLDRLVVVLDKLLRINQNGFRSNRSTAQQVLTLRRLIESIEATQDEKLVLIFIDFTKAFDSVDWNYIEQILLAYRVPKELVDAIMSLYIGAKATIRWGNPDNAKDIKLGVGVLQGDTLAPYLFIIVLDWVLRQAIPDYSLGVKLNYQEEVKSPRMALMLIMMLNISLILTLLMILH